VLSKSPYSVHRGESGDIYPSLHAAHSD